MKITQSSLSQFYGDLERTKVFSAAPVIMTPGVLFVAKNGGASGAHWLMEAIASYMPRAISGGYGEDFKYMSFWTLKVNTDKSCVLVGDDGNGNVKVKQKIEYTDFEADGDEIKFYVQWDEKYATIMLPSEY